MCGPQPTLAQMATYQVNCTGGGAQVRQHPRRAGEGWDCSTWGGRGLPKGNRPEQAAKDSTDIQPKGLKIDGEVRGAEHRVPVRLAILMALTKTNPCEVHLLCDLSHPHLSPCPRPSCRFSISIALRLPPKTVGRGLPDSHLPTWYLAANPIRAPFKICPNPPWLLVAPAPGSGREWGGSPSAGAWAAQSVLCSLAQSRN